MNIDISNAHCGPRIQFPDHAWLRVVQTRHTALYRSIPVGRYTGERLGVRRTFGSYGPRRRLKRSKTCTRYDASPHSRGVSLSWPVVASQCYLIVRRNDDPCQRHAEIVRGTGRRSNLKTKEYPILGSFPCPWRVRDVTPIRIDYGSVQRAHVTQLTLE